MRALRLRFLAVTTAALLAVVACGTPTADRTTPTGGVTAAFEAAKSGGLLKLAEFISCLTSDGRPGPGLGAFLDGFLTDAVDRSGVEIDEILATFRTSLEDFRATEVSRSGSAAVVHVSVKVTLDVDRGKLRELLKRSAEKQGVQVTDAAIDAILNRQVGMLPSTEVLEHNVNVREVDGQWNACDGAVAASPTASPMTSLPGPSVSLPPLTTPSPSLPAPPAGRLTGVRDITAGSGYTCALTGGGGVRCWGDNSNGQLGSGSSESHANAAVDVVGLSSGVLAIAARFNHTCVVTSGGGVKCWGENTRGQLGTGSPPESNVPVDVTGMTTGAIDVEVGVFGSCAIMGGGGVKCWGDNSKGRLGDGTTTNSSVPVDVAGLPGEVTAIAMGSLHTCALMSEGGVKCWGAGTVIGNGSTTDSPVPVDVVGLTSGVAAIAAGDQYTCALTTAGAVRCWGYLQGPSSAIPTDIPGLETGVTSIDVSPRTLCAVLETGAARCTDNPTVAPREAPGLEGGIRKVAVGAGAGGPGEVHLCIITTDSDVRCAGRNAVGQLGDGSTTDRQAFVDVVSSSAPGPGSSMPPASAAASAVSMGSIFACAVTSGAAKCWGSNSGGLLGNGSTTDSLLPVDVFGLGSGVSSVDAGFRHACALTTAGGVKCWGSNSFGQLGTGSNADSLIPVNVAGLASGVRAIAAGTFETCALTNAGGVRCWGSINDANAPVDVPGLTSGVSAISVGGSHSCALTTGGVVKCWDSARPAPTDVAGLDNVTAIAAGDRHACAIARDGAAKCWGLLNNSGQLGNGSTAASPSAVDVVGLGGGVTAIAAGVGHSCALTTGGAVKCWGSGDSGELGNGAKIDSHVPVDVAAVSGATGIVAGDGSTCALVIGGDIYCWGANNYGQLGNGLKAASSTPVRVSGL